MIAKVSIKTSLDYKSNIQGRRNPIRKVTRKIDTPLAQPHCRTDNRGCQPHQTHPLGYNLMTKKVVTMSEGYHLCNRKYCSHTIIYYQGNATISNWRLLNPCTNWDMSLQKKSNDLEWLEYKAFYAPRIWGQNAHPRPIHRCKFFQGWKMLKRKIRATAFKPRSGLTMWECMGTRRALQACLKLKSWAHNLMQETASSY
jgi:hypothetical protein